MARPTIYDQYGKPARPKPHCGFIEPVAKPEKKDPKGYTGHRGKE